MKFQGAGKVLLAPRDANGAPGAFRFVGCADVLNAAFTIDSFEHIERCSGNNAVDYRGIKKKSGTVTLDLTEFNKGNQALGTNGEYVDTGTPSTVTDELLPDDLVDGDVVVLGGSTPKDTITGLTIEDSGSPASTVDPADYVLDAAYGTVEFVDIAGTTYVQPFKASYGYTVKPYVSLFSAGTQEYWLRYNYINVANNSAKGIVDLYRVRFDPTDAWELINDEIQKLSLKGSMLVDDTKDEDDELGQFGRINVPA